MVSKPTTRVLALLEMLESGGTRTVAELASRLEVDERTVRRYVEHLLDLGVPVESLRGRLGGYRLAPAYRMPPLMLNDDEALAVLLGLVSGRRAGTLPVTGSARETAMAKIRRVLPERLTRRLDAVLDSVAYTASRPEPETPDSATLLPLADAVRHHRPVTLRYTDREGRRTVRTLPGSFTPPAGLDPAQRVLDGFATAAYRHEVSLHINATLQRIRTRLP